MKTMNVILAATLFSTTALADFNKQFSTPLSPNQINRPQNEDTSVESFIPGVSTYDSVRMWKRSFDERNKYWKQLYALALSSPYYTDDKSKNSNNFCEKELGICKEVQHFNVAGKAFLMMEVSDFEGKLRDRVWCYFPHESIRVCQNWDAGNITKQTKNYKGEWEVVEKEGAPQ